MTTISSLPKWVVAGLVGAVAFSAQGAEVVTFRTLPEVAYSISATVSPHAAKVFVSGVGDLGSLEKAIQPLGLERNAIVKVRANLRPDAGGNIDMEGWNKTWTAFFPDATRRPARTTLGSSALPAGADGVYVEAVAAYLPAVPGEVPAGSKPALNPYVRAVGEGAYGSAAAAVVLPGTAILFSAGTLADPADLTQPERSVARYGTMAVQAKSVFKKLAASLAAQGLQLEDVFYVRALMSLVPGETAVDYAGFGEVFSATFAGRSPAMKPALAMWAAPGFSAQGQLIEIEVYAAAPDGRGPFAAYAAEAPANPWLKMTGQPEAQISSSGYAARYRALTWMSGIVPPASTTGDMHDHSVGALLVMRSRLRDVGHTLGDLVELRAHPVVGAEFRKNLDLWNEAYGRFFNLPKINPHKPARTAFPVGTLPRGTVIEIEAIAVER